jgi:hypothetical protein
MIMTGNAPIIVADYDVTEFSSTTHQREISPLRPDVAA